MPFKMAILPPEYQEEWPEKIREAIPGAVVEVFKTAEEAEAYIQDADCAYGFVTPELFSRARKLRWIQCNAASPSPSFWHDALLKSDVTVTNFRGIYNDHVAAHALAFVLALARNLPEYARWQQRSVWGPVKATTYLPEATVLIVGLGGIGAETARLCAAFGMTVTGIDPRVKSPPPFVTAVHPPEALDILLPQADFLILVTPETPETLGMIDAKRLNLMKPGAFLVNVGRGRCVVMEDLVEALITKKIAGAALDVFEQEPLPSDNPLWSMSNVLITPMWRPSPTPITSRNAGPEYLLRTARDSNSVSHSSTWSISRSGFDARVQIISSGGGAMNPVHGSTFLRKQAHIQRRVRFICITAFLMFSSMSRFPRL